MLCSKLYCVQKSMHCCDVARCPLCELLDAMLRSMSTRGMVRAVFNTCFILLTKLSPFLFSRSSYARCDCCDGPMFGPGVRVIKAPPEMFGVKNLPFLFNACTQTCRRQFSKSPQSLQEWMKRNVPLNTSF